VLYKPVSAKRKAPGFQRIQVLFVGGRTATPVERVLENIAA